MTSLEVEQIEQKEPQLPKGFVVYVEDKLAKNGAGGRPHIVKQLNSMEGVLKILKIIWCEGNDIKSLAKSLKVDYKTIWRLIKDLEQFRIEIAEYLNYQEQIKPKDFRSYPSIENWKKQIILSKHISSLKHIRILETICCGEILTEFKCNPEKFNLEIAQDFAHKYNVDKGKSIPRHLIMSIRSFLASKGIVIPRGFGGQYGLSGEKDSYGKYAHIKANEEQLNIIREHLKQYNDNFDIGFDIGIQTCSRAFAIAGIPKSRMRKEGKICIIEVFEPKIKEGDEWFGYIGKWWKKYITKELYERIENIKNENNGELLFPKNDTKRQINLWLYGLVIRGKKIRLGFCDVLKEAYTKAGLTDKYFYKKPIHSLRHIGAHRLLQLTDYNYEIVAKLGGWKTAQILKDCYGEMPDDIILKVIERLK